MIAAFNAVEIGAGHREREVDMETATTRDDSGRPWSKGRDALNNLRVQIVNVEV